MPGTPDPLLGSRLANWGVALALSLLLVLGPLRYSRRATPGRLAAASGVLAAAVGLTVWALPRVATGAFGQFSYPDPVVALGLYAVGTVVLAVQVAGPVYGFLRYGLVSPLAAAVGATALAAFLFFQLGGETESFGLYVLFSPLVVAVILGVAVLEGGLRRLAGSGVVPG